MGKVNFNDIDKYKDEPVKHERFKSNKKKRPTPIYIKDSSSKLED